MAASVSIHDAQRAHLLAVIGWAERAASALGEAKRANAHRIFFRPASTGVSMVGLLPDRPQRGRSPRRDLEALARGVDRLFEDHCQQVGQGRGTPEKALQSYLIAQAQTSGLRLDCLERAAEAAGHGGALSFVTDELAMPGDGDKIVCDIIATRATEAGEVPVVIELKTERAMTRLLEQLERYAALVDEHVGLYERLASAQLGRVVRFDGPCERWLVWPEARGQGEPRAPALAARGVKVVSFVSGAGSYRFTMH